MGLEECDLALCSLQVKALCVSAGVVEWSQILDFLQSNLRHSLHVWWNATGSGSPAEEGSWAPCRAVSPVSPAVVGMGSPRRARAIGLSSQVPTLLVDWGPALGLLQEQMQFLFAGVVFSPLALHLLMDQVLPFFCPWYLLLLSPVDIYL